MTRGMEIPKISPKFTLSSAVVLDPETLMEVISKFGVDPVAWNFEIMESASVVESFVCCSAMKEETSEPPCKLMKVRSLVLSVHTRTSQ